MVFMTKTNQLIKSMTPRAEIRTPIATEIFLPNHSGDHSKGHTGTPVNDTDIANKAYVDTQISDNSFWKRAGTIVSQKNIGDEINLVMSSTQRRSLYVDGATNDFTSAYTGVSCYVNEFRREYNVGTGFTPENIVNVGSYLVIKHTEAELASSYTYAMNFSLYDTGKHYNTTAVSKTMNQYGIQGTILTSGTIDNTSTGGAIIQHFGVSGSITDTTILKNTGGTNPTQVLYNYALEGFINSNPTVTSGNWSVVNKGLNISVAGTAAGSSSNYGIYILQVTGADINRSIYDVSGQMWYKSGGDFLMRTDSSKFSLGQGDDSYLLFNGSGMVIKSNQTTAGDYLDLQTGDLKINSASGATGTFTTTDLKTVTVTKGIITSIV